MKMRIRAPRGIASKHRLGSVRDPATGQTATPTFAAGDAMITQNDGVGTDQADNIPTVDGTDILWTISAAEATPPSANGPNRVLQLYDQTNPKVWVDLDVVIEVYGNYGFTPDAIADGSVELPPAAETEINPLRMIAEVVESDEPLDIGASAIIDGWTAATQVATMSGNWSRTPTGTLSSLRILLWANPLDAARIQAAAQAALTASGITTADGVTRIAGQDIEVGGSAPASPIGVA